MLSLRPARQLGRGEPRLAARARLRRAARGGVARRGQQARRQHPEEGRGRRRQRGRPGAAARAGRAALDEALRAVAAAAEAAFATGDYAASLHALAALKAPVDAFFDAVMVNADDAALRANRLALLAALHAAMNRVADLSRLAG